MFRRAAGTLLLSLLVSLGWPAIASAHVLKIDGDIGAVLHINPDDNPTTGGPTQYIVSFDDDSGRFSLPKCNCSVSIIDSDNTLATKPLVVSSPQISVDTYTFKKPAVYIMRFTGTPKQPGSFQSFALNYEVRVTNGNLSAQSFPLLLWIGMGMGVGLVLVAAYALDYDTYDVKRRRG